MLSGAELKELWNRAGPSVAEEASRRFAGEDLSDQDIEFEGMPTARSPR